MKVMTVFYTDSHDEKVRRPTASPVQWRIAGYGVIANEQGECLMVLSGDGRWHFPGGEIELENDEMIAEGIARECREETGYPIIVDTTQPPLFVNEQRFYHRRKEQFYHSLQLFYAAKVTGPQVLAQVREADQARHAQWVALSSLQADTIHSTIWPHYEFLLSHVNAV